MSEARTRPPRVFLIGFMAAGKSTVGALLAERLGVDFVDLDDDIERAARTSVRAIFESRGEPGFRELESAALARLLDAPGPAIIATGGGAPCHGDNLERMRASGLVVELGVSFDTASERISGEATRPLFAGPMDEVRALHARRQRVYRGAHACVSTERRSPTQVADEVLAVVACARSWPGDLLDRSTFLALGDRSYPVVVAPGLLARAGELARAVTTLGEDDAAHLAIVTDENVAPLYAGALEHALRDAGWETSLHVVPAGERSKSFAEMRRLCDELVRAGLTRDAAIVALGGGVVGDLAGLVAAVLFRGIACIQIPTTLLAMVDAAIGGKTGIDLPGVGKNLVGAFWQPRAVIADPRVLATLPPREERAAFGEVLKYGLLDGEGLLETIERALDESPPGHDAGAGAGAGTAEALTRIIHRCVAYKSAIVGRDERDRLGERALLNLGHTVGHAVEVAGGFEELLHGEAVALGLVAACRVSARLGLCDPGLEERVVRALERAGLPRDLAPWLRAGALEHLRADKKRVGRGVDFIVVEEIGRCSVRRISMDELARILRIEFTV